MYIYFRVSSSHGPEEELPSDVDIVVDFCVAKEVRWLVDQQLESLEDEFISAQAGLRSELPAENALANKTFEFVSFSMIFFPFGCFLKFIFVPSQGYQ